MMIERKKKKKNDEVSMKPNNNCTIANTNIVNQAPSLLKTVDIETATRSVRTYHYFQTTRPSRTQW